MADEVRVKLTRTIVGRYGAAGELREDVEPWDGFVVLAGTAGTLRRVRRDVRAIREDFRRGRLGVLRDVDDYRAPAFDLAEVDFDASLIYRAPAGEDDPGFAPGTPWTVLDVPLTWLEVAGTSVSPGGDAGTAESGRATSGPRASVRGNLVAALRDARDCGLLDTLAALSHYDTVNAFCDAVEALRP